MIQDQARVLIVDDKPENLHALEATLRPLGVEVVKATSGNEALSKLLKSSFACVMLDVQMPEIDGFETACYIREDPELADTPIIFVTAYSNQKSQIFQGYASGAVDYLTKPLDPYIVRSKVKIFVDLYDQKRLIKIQAAQLFESNRQLAEKNEELERFAAIAAHDLKSPVCTLISFADIISSGRQIPLQKIQEFAARISHNGRQLIQQIDALLEYAKIGQQTIKRERVDCRSVIEEVSQLLEEQFRLTGAHLEIRSLLPAIMGDRTFISRLFQNVIGNSLKYHHPDRAPMVVIDGYEKNGRLYISVKDNGQGINKMHLSKVLEPFKRFQTGHQGGIGLGLAICEKIARWHGSRIEVNSEEGVGTTLSFSLELADSVSSFTDLSQNQIQNCLNISC